MKSRKKIYVVILSIVIVFIISFGLYHVLEESKKLLVQNEKAFDNDLPATYTLPREDSELINDAVVKRIKVLEVINSKVRTPIASLSIDDYYNLIVYKLPILSNRNLIDIVSLKKQDAAFSYYYTYGTIGSHIPFSFHYVFNDSIHDSKLILSYNGDSFSNYQVNQNLIIYSLKLKNFSIRYSDKDPVDILLDKPSKIYQPLIPLDIAFIKKNDRIFLIILSSKPKQSSLQPNELLKLILH